MEFEDNKETKIEKTNQKKIIGLFIFQFLLSLGFVSIAWGIVQYGDKIEEEKIKAPAQSVESDCNFKNTDEFLRYVEQNIQANWHPAYGSSYKSEKVVVSFFILRSGSISKKKIINSSKNNLIDAYALAALEKTKLNCPLPSFLKGDEVPIEFTFVYNVINK